MKVISAPKTIIENKDSIFNYFAWPSVTRLNDGSIAAVCSGFRLMHVCPFGKAVLSRSYDEGKTWSKPMPVIDTPLDDRDAGVLAAKDKTIITSFNNSAEFQRTTSEKYDKSYAELTKAYLNCIPEDSEKRFLGSTYIISRDNCVTFEDIRISPVTSPHGPIETSDGRILWIGRSFSEDVSRINGTSGIYCCELDKSDNFVPISKITISDDEVKDALACEPYAVYLPDGRILVAIRVDTYSNDPLFTVYICESKDGGYTFSEPYRIIDKQAGSPPHFILLSSGKLVMTYARRKDEYGIRYIVSDDYGKTFSKENILTCDSPHHDLGYPSSVELKDGNILTVYYEYNGKSSVIKQVIWSL